MENLGLVARIVSYISILLVVGTVGFRLLILKRSGLSVGIVGRGSRRSAAVGVYASLGIIVADFAKLVVQTAEMRFPSDSWIAVGSTMLFDTKWGTAWLVQVAIAILLAMTFTLARKDALPRWNVLAVLCVGLAATPAFASHAMSARRLGQYTVAADALHILAASMWLGTLTVMFFSVIGNDGSEPASELSVSEMRANYIEALLRSFSPVALVGSAVVVMSGLVSSLAHVSTITELTATAYGQTLMGKVIWASIVAALGYRNWKVVTPKVRAEGPRRMTRGMAIELVVTLVVILVTSLLVVTPPPGEG